VLDALAKRFEVGGEEVLEPLLDLAGVAAALDDRRVGVPVLEQRVQQVLDADEFVAPALRLGERQR
jgi:hypothetical protein